MSTDCLFREDSYLKDCSATVVALTETGGVVLDRTIFYAASGGQPGDTGTLRSANGNAIRIASAAYVDREKTEITHSPAVSTGLDLKIGEPCISRSTGTFAMRACACTRRCICSRRCCLIQ